MVSVNGVSRYFFEGDLRVVEACFRRIKVDGLLAANEVFSASEGADIINRAIASQQEWDRQEKKDYAKKLKSESKQILIPLEELEWFRKDDRACCWVWGKIAFCQLYSAPGHPLYQRPLHQRPLYQRPLYQRPLYPSPSYQPALYQPLLHQRPLDHQAAYPMARSYNDLNLKSATSSSKERFDEVVKYLDRCEQPLEWQRDLITSLQGEWGQIYAARKPFSWLEQDNEEQVRWAWEYLKKGGLGYNNKPSVYNFSPTGPQEMYLMIYAAFDLWGALPDTKRLFIGDFNKAWQQKKHRDNREGKKVCNLVLREEVKSKLDCMAVARNMKLNQLVEILIENEYERIG